jgi:multidrug efflux system membrane fusion protein
VGLGLAIAAAAVAFLVARAHRGGKDHGLAAEAGGESAHAAGPKGAGAGADKPVPVLLAKAATRDVPITLEGLGTVTAYKTANVRPQVDGLLQKVIFREGQAVKQGEQLAQIDPRPFEIQLHQAQAALARDSGQLRGAERDLIRYEAVVSKQLIPQQQVDDQRATVEQLRGAVQGDEATIESAKLNLDYARIRSPLAGVTGVRQVDPGNLVHATDATGIVVVTQLDPIAVIFTLPQDDLPRVAAALALQKGTGLPVEALTRDGAQALATGTLEVVDNQINTATATIRIKALFPNPNRRLWPNQFVKTRLELSVRKGALVVPAVAVQRGPEGTFVYVASAAGTADPRPVTVDLIEGDQALLSKGVAAGEDVVIEGQNQLRPGAKIVVRNAPGASPSDGAGAGGRAGGPPPTGAPRLPGARRP